MEGRPRLESWKEISAYLKRSVKTCQRWEIELGLPVHRLDGTPYARVFADPDELDAWIAEKLSHIRERPDGSRAGHFDTKKALRIAAVTLAVVASGVLLIGGARLAWHGLISPPPAFPPVTPYSLAVLPFENRTGDPKLDPWRIAIPHLIFFDLNQSRAVSVQETLNLLVDLRGLKLVDVPRYSDEDLRTIGKKKELEFLVRGSIVKSGRDIILEISVHDGKTANFLGSFRSAFASPQGMFSAVDRLTPQIKLAAGVPRRLVSADIDEKVANITTSTPQAFEALCRGTQLISRGRASDAVPEFEEALRLDPGFAEASQMMYWTAHGTFGAGDDAEALRAGRRVLGMIDRLGLKSRLGFEAHFYRYVQSNLAKSVSALERQWETFSDAAAGSWLAQTRLGLEDPEGAIPILESLVARWASPSTLPFTSDLRDLLAFCYAARGQMDRAEKVIDEYLAGTKMPQADLLASRSNIALTQGQFDKALSYLDRLYGIYPRGMFAVKYSRGAVYLTRDDLDSAEKDFARIADKGAEAQRSYGFRLLMAVSLSRGKISEALGLANSALRAAENFGDTVCIKEAHYYLAYVQRLAGNLPAALAEAELASRDYSREHGPVGVRALQLKALIVLDLERMGEFEKLAAELKVYVEKEQYPKLMRAYHYLLGAREMKLENWGQAVDHFSKAAALLPSLHIKQTWDADAAQYWFALAEARERSGRCAEAQDAFARISPIWDERFGSGDLYARKFYRIARLQELCGEHPLMTGSESQAEKASAIKNYQKFLGLWKDADPQFSAEVDDATRRLTALQEELAPTGSVRAPSK